jgi:4,5-dihydroxyphthalate decarboxylase
MSKLLPITIACAEYDRTRAIKDGRVRVDGCEVTYLPLDPEELFFRAFRYHDFDVAELSFNSYLMTTSRGVCPYVAIPAFVSRHFRHSAIFIRIDRSIHSPADLKGKLVGLPEYQQTANVWMRGIFKEEYGLDPADIRWRTGGQEEPGRDERTPLKLTGNIDLQPIDAGKTLNRMLVDGELDAVFSARALVLRAARPQCRTAVFELPPSGDGILPTFRNVSDHASDRHQKEPCRTLSVAAGHGLQSVLPGQADCDR